MKTILVATLLSLSLSTGPDGAEQHLKAGATAFREGRYDEALVEFRVAQKRGAQDAAAYAAAALVKLGRAEEALDAFGSVDAPTGDPLLDFYRAMACYDARLYACADRFLAGVASQGGPGMSEQAARTRAAIAAVLGDQPTTGTIDWYLARCENPDPRRARLATAYCAEAVALSQRRPDAYGKVRAQQVLANARKAGAAR